MQDIVFEKNISYLFKAHNWNSDVFLLLECKGTIPFGDITIFKDGKIERISDKSIELLPNNDGLSFDSQFYWGRTIEKFDDFVSGNKAFSQHVKDYLSNSRFLNAGEKVTFPAWYLFGLEYYNGVVYIEAKENGKYDVALIKNVAIDSTPVKYCDCYISYNTYNDYQFFGIFDNDLNQIYDASCGRISSTEIEKPASYQQFLEQVSMKKEEHIIDIFSSGIKFTYEIDDYKKIIVENVGEGKYNLIYYRNFCLPYEADAYADSYSKEEFRNLKIEELLYKLAYFDVIRGKDLNEQLSILAKDSKRIDSIEQETKRTADLRARAVQPFAFMEKGKIYTYKYEYSNSSHGWKDAIVLRCLDDGLFDVCFFDSESSYGYHEFSEVNKPSNGSIGSSKRVIEKCKIVVNYDRENSQNAQIEFYDPNTLEIIKTVNLGKRGNCSRYKFEEQSSNSWVNTLETFNREFDEYLKSAKKRVANGTYLDNLNHLFFDNRLMINLIYSNESSYSSTVAYRPILNGSEPYFNNETSDYKSWHGLDSLIELLRECIKRYDYVEGNKLFDVIIHNRTKLGNWLNSFDVDADNDFSKGEQLGQNYINAIKKAIDGLLQHINLTQQELIPYFESSYSSEFYDDKYQSSTSWPNPIEQLKNGIQKLESLFVDFSKSYDNVEYGNDAEANQNFEQALSEWKKESENPIIDVEADLDSIVEIVKPKQAPIKLSNNKLLNALFKAVAAGKKRINSIIDKYFLSHNRGMNGGSL